MIHTFFLRQRGYKLTKCEGARALNWTLTNVYQRMTRRVHKINCNGHENKNIEETLVATSFVGRVASAWGAYHLGRCTCQKLKRVGDIGPLQSTWVCGAYTSYNSWPGETWLSLSECVHSSLGRLVSGGHEQHVCIDGYVKKILYINTIETFTLRI